MSKQQQRRKWKQKKIREHCCDEKNVFRPLIAHSSLHEKIPLLQYFPTTITTWIVYCVIIFSLVTALKLINLSLHKMYDKARTLSETSLKKLSSGNAGSGIASSKIQRETSGWVIKPLHNCESKCNFDLFLVTTKAALSFKFSIPDPVEHCR